jgi:predicted GTPase
MEVRIGVLHSPKELTLELEGSPDDVTQALDDALKKEDSVLWLTDTKGRRVGVPAERVAYVEIETESGAKRVGFGA